MTAAGNAIVFVDAGYLLKALLIHIGIQSREDVEVDGPADQLSTPLLYRSTEASEQRGSGNR